MWTFFHMFYYLIYYKVNVLFFFISIHTINLHIIIDINDNNFKITLNIFLVPI